MAPSRAVAVLLNRCPVCLKGPAFRSLLLMHKNCPVCGVHFERETGFFLNSMFFAYTMGFIILAPTALYLYLRGVSTAWFTGIVSAEVLLLWPWVHRYSRTLWMHLDQLLDPRRPVESDPPPAAQ